MTVFVLALETADVAARTKKKSPLITTPVAVCVYNKYSRMKGGVKDGRRDPDQTAGNLDGRQRSNLIEKLLIELLQYSMSYSSNAPSF